MGKEQETKAKPGIVVLDKAFRLAEEWVSKMSPSSVEEKCKGPEPPRLPPRSGLGIKPRKNVEVGVSTDPLQKGLLRKLAYLKNKSKSQVELEEPKGDEFSEDEDESESKAKAFSKTKKRGAADFTFPSNKKKRKQKQTV